MGRNPSTSVRRRLSFACAAFLALVCAGWLSAAASTGPASPRRDTERPGVCERQAVKLVGQQAVQVGRTVKAPKKIRNVSPHYPPLPPAATGRGMWTGEVLIDTQGRVSQVWPIREVEITPPLPAFNKAIADAIRQWEFEPFVANKMKLPVCMTVTITIDWS
jgi:outer membrane biosynthesis protein TonB